MNISKVIFGAIQDYYSNRSAPTKVVLDEESVIILSLSTIGQATKAWVTIDGEQPYIFLVSAHTNTGRVYVELLESVDVFSTTYTNAESIYNGEPRS